MARNLTARSWEAIAHQQTNDVFILLLDIAFHNGTDWECIHLCNNSTDIISAASGPSTTYIAFPLAINLPSDESNVVSVGTLTVSNVTQELIGRIRALAKPMQVTVSVINAEEPDVYVGTWPCFIWRQLVYNVNTITGQISLENFLSEPYPGGTFTSSIAPGLFV